MVYRAVDYFDLVNIYFKLLNGNNAVYFGRKVGVLDFCSTFGLLINGRVS
jgi:hypothetical protein